MRYQCFLCCFRVNLEPSRTLMVGDRSVEWRMGIDNLLILEMHNISFVYRANTDMKFGRDHGMKTLLVLTGITSREDIPQLPDDCKPEFFTKSIGEMLSCRT